MRLTFLFFLHFFVLLVSVVRVYGTNPTTNFVTLSLIMENPSSWSESYYTKLVTFLEAVGFKKWNFALWEEGFKYWLDNSTRLDKLKEFGYLIPRLEYSQLYTPDARVSRIDNLFGNWSDKVGYTPDGVFDFIPDTYSCNYLYSLGVKYWQGYCFDQYCIDYMSMRGAWQLPYYADTSNCAVPKPSGKGIIIFPHVTWDWLARFKVAHAYNTHPLNALDVYPNPDDAKAYIEKVLEYNAEGCKPFSYASLQTEWCWLCDKGADTMFKEICLDVLADSRFNVLSYDDLVSWFLIHYASNPTYEVNFYSPESQDHIEWYWSTSFRVARVGGQVVNYINYKDQTTDPYITSTASINWSKPGTPCDPDNQIDTSLKLRIDALGGGNLSNPIATAPYGYTGMLEQFPLNYVPEKSGLEKTVGLAIFVAIASGIVGLIAFILRKGCFKQNGSKNCQDSRRKHV